MINMKAYEQDDQPPSSICKIRFFVKTNENLVDVVCSFFMWFQFSNRTVS